MTGIPLLFEVSFLLVTGSMERFLWLSSQSIPALIIVWPISVPLLIWLYFGWNSCLKRDELGSLRLLWLTPLIVLPITMLFWGALFYNPDFYSGIYDRGHISFLRLIFLSMFVIAILAILSNHGRNSFVIPFSLIALLINFFCAFAAGSAISGEWI
ncbi:hypothetical protein [Gimesia alba]|uniref:hypothetical protein n=1 Tax=Gimesia alba TaxID=2527973 RepID=UPI00119C93DF|nr:hypothetical protein [Gimesia alba]